jgi:hypothetical protein
VLRQQQAQQGRPVDPRETELEATIGALKTLDPTIAGSALEKAERELEALRHQYDTAATTAAVNSASVLRLLEWTAAVDLETQHTPEQWERLTDLVRLVPVSLTTRQHPTRTFGGGVVVLDQAFLRRGTEMEESIRVADLPPFGITGGAFNFAELALALRMAKMG